MVKPVETVLNKIYSLPSGICQASWGNRPFKVSENYLDKGYLCNKRYKANSAASKIKESYPEFMSKLSHSVLKECVGVKSCQVKRLSQERIKKVLGKVGGS